ncbi:MAG: hypothetical protein GC166_04470 [Alphaproteobacteria bacterium]|nr:hypothetical protein [Alphaproteobacteria bacterium]
MRKAGGPRCSRPAMILARAFVIAVLWCVLPFTAGAAPPLDLRGLFNETSRQHWPKQEVPTGTGFFVNAAGDLITAAHVIAGCGRIEVTIPAGAGTRKGRAVLMGLDARIDAALLSVPSLRPTPFFRMAMGSPPEGSHLMVPIWSVRDRKFQVTKARLAPAADHPGSDPLLQLDADLNPGASGAAVLEADGTVTGYVVGRLARNKDIALAVPEIYARHFLEYMGVRPAVRHNGGEAEAVPGSGWAKIECR